MILFAFKLLILLMLMAIALMLVMRVCRCFSLPWPKFRLENDAIYTFYGAPGSGKTTILAHYAKIALRAGITVYSNVPIKGCRQFDKSDFGVFLMENCLILWDEIGVDAHARNFKSNFTMDAVKFFKEHRHENAELMVFSQGFEDPDKVIRVLSTDLYVVSRYPQLSLFRNFIKCRRMEKKPDLDELTHKPDDIYFWKFFGVRRVYAPPCWKLFDSWHRLGLPQKPIWHVFGEGDLVYDPVNDDYVMSEIQTAEQPQ